MRDYELADEFADTPLWLEEVIDDEGDWSPRGEGIQELGANYFALELDDDTYRINLDTEAELEVYGIGIDGDDADVFFLGDRGVIDTYGYDDFYLMVFNPEYDYNVDIRNYEEYSIEIESVNRDPEERSASLDASNFVPLELSD